MSLGIYDRLWELLGDGCNKLDLLLAEHSSPEGRENSFQDYVIALKKKDQFEQDLAIAEQRVAAIDQLVTFLTLHSTDPAQDQGLNILREASSKSLLGVADVVTKSTKVT